MHYPKFRLTPILLAFVMAAIFSSVGVAAGKKFTVSSPDKKVNVQVEVGDKIYYSVAYNGKEIITKSPVSMTLYDGKVLGASPKVEKNTTKSVNNVVKPLYGIASSYVDNFNELILQFKDNYSLHLRAYNDGAAYRFATSIPGKIKIKNEEVNFNFPEDYTAYFSIVPDLKELTANSYEAAYTRKKISEQDSGMSYLPLLVEVPNGPNVLITEVDLLDYAGLYLKSNGKKGLVGVLPTVVTKSKLTGWNNVMYNLTPTERADYIAETQGTRTFPWRLVAFADEDKDLLNNNLVYLLATENKIKDVSWIKPGKVAWDWWNANNLTGVDFKTGYNTETFKYFIDFAAKNGIEYVNIDEGWSNSNDMTKITDKLNMEEVMQYAKSKNVGIFLWCIWHTLDKQLDYAMNQFEKWGIAGIKVDFMDRDDQEVVNFYERIASEAAKRKILVNYHGAMKPTGLARTYPNIVNREGVQGLEYNKFSDKCSPEHAATIPFIRMFVGPMDYTPGAMQNYNKKEWRKIEERPMSQGTRGQQLAMYVMYYAPLEMMADAPTAYEKEPEILNFLAKVPTVWDETKALDGKVGDFAVIARRKGDAWYLGGLTDWDPRKLKVNFGFLGNGAYEAEIFSDGVNADRVGSDYKRTVKKVSKSDELTLDLAPGGGFAIKLTPVK